MDVKYTHTQRHTERYKSFIWPTKWTTECCFTSHKPAVNPLRRWQLIDRCYNKADMCVGVLCMRVRVCLSTQGRQKKHVTKDIKTYMKWMKHCRAWHEWTLLVSVSCTTTYSGPPLVLFLLIIKQIVILFITLNRHSHGIRENWRHFNGWEKDGNKLYYFKIFNSHFHCTTCLIRRTRPTSRNM